MLALSCLPAWPLQTATREKLISAVITPPLYEIAAAGVMLAASATAGFISEQLSFCSESTPEIDGKFDQGQFSQNLAC
jgi:hypothetical protein